MNREAQIALARRVCEAKAEYWDALSAFERATADADDGYSWDDSTNDAVIGEIDLLVAGGVPSEDDLGDLVNVATGEAP